VWDQPFINNCSILAPSARLPEITVPMGVHSLGAGMAFEIISDLNSEQLLLDVAYAYTSRFPHRQIPTGAPDSYASHHTGTLSDHIAAYELFLNPPTTQEPTQSTAETRTDPNQSDAPHPLAPPQENDPTLTWIYLLVTALMLALVIALRPRKKRRRRKRKNRPATV
jgi:hypothetical protein